MEGALSKITANTEKYAALGVPYIPTISTCWDAVGASLRYRLFTPELQW
jgi:hypothetical protein